MASSPQEGSQQDNKKWNVDVDVDVGFGFGFVVDVIVPWWWHETKGKSTVVLIMDLCTSLPSSGLFDGLLLPSQWRPKSNGWIGRPNSKAVNFGAVGAVGAPRPPLERSNGANWTTLRFVAFSWNAGCVFCFSVALSRKRSLWNWRLIYQKPSDFPSAPSCRWWTSCSILGVDVDIDIDIDIDVLLASYLSHHQPRMKHFSGPANIWSCLLSPSACASCRLSDPMAALIAIGRPFIGSLRRSSFTVIHWPVLHLGSRLIGLKCVENRFDQRLRFKPHLLRAAWP